jgi:DNA-binding CsgD family transcriptional regulator
MEGPITPYEIERMCEWRAQNVPVLEIARRLRRSDFPVRKYTKGIRPSMGNRHLKPEVKAEILRMHADGYRNIEITQYLGLRPNAVCRFLRRQGLWGNKPK